MTDKFKSDALTEVDRAAAEELAQLLGVSADDVIEEFANLTLEQEAELEELLDQFNEAAPAMFESLDRMSESLAQTGAKMRDLKKLMSRTDKRLAKIENRILSGALDFSGKPFQALDQT